MNILSVKNLKKYYGHNKALVDISFNLKKGEIYGFIGPNGAGKSTTIKSIMNLINYQNGIIKIFGTDAKEEDRAIKSKIGYLPS